MAKASPQDSSRPASQDSLIRRHLWEGWVMLLLFSVLGVALEMLLAFKAPFYLDVESDARRLMWRLAHAHGTLLALLQLGLSWTLYHLPSNWFPSPARFVSWLFSSSSLLIPAGFFLSGWGAESGDPGALIALVPAGALSLCVGIVLVCWGLRKSAMGRRFPDVD